MNADSPPSLYPFTRLKRLVGELGVVQVEGQGNLLAGSTEAKHTVLNRA